MYQGVGRTQEVFLRYKVSTVRFIRFCDRGSSVGWLHSEILFSPSSASSRPDWGLLPKSTELQMNGRYNGHQLCSVLLTMMGLQSDRSELFSYQVILEKRIGAKNPLRAVRIPFGTPARVYTKR